MNMQIDRNGVNTGARNVASGQLHQKMLSAALMAKILAADTGCTFALKEAANHINKKVAEAKQAIETSGPNATVDYNGRTITAKELLALVKTDAFEINVNQAFLSSAHSGDIKAWIPLDNLTTMSVAQLKGYMNSSAIPWLDKEKKKYKSGTVDYKSVEEAVKDIQAQVQALASAQAAINPAQIEADAIKVYNNSQAKSPILENLKAVADKVEAAAKGAEQMKAKVKDGSLLVPYVGADGKSYGDRSLNLYLNGGNAAHNGQSVKLDGKVKEVKAMPDGADTEVKWIQSAMAALKAGSPVPARNQTAAVQPVVSAEIASVVDWAQDIDVCIRAIDNADKYEQRNPKSLKVKVISCPIECTIDQFMAIYRKSGTTDASFQFDALDKKIKSLSTANQLDLNISTRASTQLRQQDNLWNTPFPELNFTSGYKVLNKFAVSGGLGLGYNSLTTVGGAKRVVAEDRMSVKAGEKAPDWKGGRYTAHHTPVSYDLKFDYNHKGEVDEIKEKDGKKVVETKTANNVNRFSVYYSKIAPLKLLKDETVIILPNAQGVATDNMVKKTDYDIYKQRKFGASLGLGKIIDGEHKFNIGTDWNAFSAQGYSYGYITKRENNTPIKLNIKTGTPNKDGVFTQTGRINIEYHHETGYIKGQPFIDNNVKNKYLGETQPEIIENRIGARYYHTFKGGESKWSYNISTGTGLFFEHFDTFAPKPLIQGGVDTGKLEIDPVTKDLISYKNKEIRSIRPVLITNYNVTVKPTSRLSIKVDGMLFGVIGMYRAEKSFNPDGTPLPVLKPGTTTGETTTDFLPVKKRDVKAKDATTDLLMLNASLTVGYSF